MSVDGEEFYKHMMAEVHELNKNILELAGQVESLKKYMADIFNRVVWVQQKLGLRRMPRK